MEESVQRFPLQWPAGWRRTPYDQRRTSNFTEIEKWQVEGAVKSRSKVVTMATAVERLDRQLDMLDGRDATLSTNVRLTLRGLPHGSDQPSDPGVAVYFRFKGRATVLACDSYTRVAENIAALAAHIDALRRIERYGVGTIEQALAGYRALPADTAADWRNVFGFNGGPVTAEQVNRKFKELAKDKHPDRGGTEEGMAHLNRAREYALQEVLS